MCPAAVRIIIAAAHAAPCFIRSHRLGDFVAVTVSSSSEVWVCASHLSVSVAVLLCPVSVAWLSSVPFSRCRCLILAFTGGLPVVLSVGWVVS